MVYRVARTALGWAAVAATARGLCALLLADAREQAESRLLGEFPWALAASPKHPVQGLLTAALEQLSTKRGTTKKLPLDLRGTPFQLAVWRRLQKIPRGKTSSYREVAEQLGMPRAARAVATACAANRLAVLIPCHRVVRGDGTLSGYRWGAARKRALLATESANPTSSRLKREVSSRNAE